MHVPETITFSPRPTRVGQVTLRTSEEETRLAFLPAGPGGEPVTVLTSSKTRQVRREQVVHLRGAVPERLRVTFVEDVTTVETNGERERTVAPLSGHTYEVERKTEGAALGVFEANGAPARFGVAAQVSGQYRSFGRTPPAQSELPLGPQRVGQSAPELADTLLESIGQGATITAVEVPSTTLIEIIEGPEGALHGLYRVDVKVTGASGGSKVQMTLTGTLVVRDVDGAMLEMRLQGAVTSSPDGAADSAVPAGAGDFKLTQTLVYASA
jgi:hypothetical protein